MTELTNIHCVPELGINLFSITKMPHFTILFRNHRAEAYNAEHKLITTASKINNLYQIKGTAQHQLL